MAGLPWPGSMPAAVASLIFADKPVRRQNSLTDKLKSECLQHNRRFGLTSAVTLTWAHEVSQRVFQSPKKRGHFMALAPHGFHVGQRLAVPFDERKSRVIRKLQAYPNYQIGSWPLWCPSKNRHKALASASLAGQDYLIHPTARPCLTRRFSGRKPAARAGLECSITSFPSPSPLSLCVHQE